MPEKNEIILMQLKPKKLTVREAKNIWLRTKTLPETSWLSNGKIALNKKFITNKDLQETLQNHAREEVHQIPESKIKMGIDLIVNSPDVFDCIVYGSCDLIERGLVVLVGVFDVENPPPTQHGVALKNRYCELYYLLYKEQLDLILTCIPNVQTPKVNVSGGNFILYSATGEPAAILMPFINKFMVPELTRKELEKQKIKYEFKAKKVGFGLL